MADLYPCMKEIPDRRPNKDEEELMRSYVLHPSIMDILERDKKIMSGSDLKLLDVYSAKLTALQAALEVELQELKREMRKRGIKVYDRVVTPERIEAKYLCRGYKGGVSYWSNLIRSITVIKLSELLQMEVPGL